jgi:hypothetical protein
MNLLSQVLTCFVLLVPAHVIVVNGWPSPNYEPMFQTAKFSGGFSFRAMTVNSAPPPDYEFHNNVSFAFVTQFSDSKYIELSDPTSTSIFIFLPSFADVRT